MSGLLVVAALMLAVLGLAHSGAGELFILRHLGRLRPIPAVFGGARGGERSLRAAWHHLSILAWTFALILFHDASLSELGPEERFVIRMISISLALGALVWYAGTGGKNLAWVAMLLIAVLCWAAA
ncbi:MAG: hypothetical protein JOZ41_08525 [Chloroflexi bacterium]|nr:hypothetical protein [Chloroflexota bacterium]